MEETAGVAPPVPGTGGGLRRATLRLAVLAGLLLTGWLCGCALAHTAAAAQPVPSSTSQPDEASASPEQARPTGLLGAILSPITTAVTGTPAAADDGAAAEDGTAESAGSGLGSDALAAVTQAVIARAPAVTGTVDSPGVVPALLQRSAEASSTPRPASHHSPTPRQQPPSLSRSLAGQPPASHHRTPAAAAGTAATAPTMAPSQHPEPEQGARGVTGRPVPPWQPPEPQVPSPPLPPMPSPPAPGSVAIAGHATGGDHTGPAALPDTQAACAPVPRLAAVPVMTTPTRSIPGLPTITPD